MNIIKIALLALGLILSFTLEAQQRLLMVLSSYRQKDTKADQAWV